MLNFSPEQKQRWLIFVIIWVLAGSLGVYSRLYPLRHFVSSDADEHASMLVMGNLQKAAAQSITRENPALPDFEQKKLFQKRFSDMVRTQPDKVRETIYETARKMDAQNPYGQKYPFLLASDSYYYYGLTENIIKSGAIGPQVRGSKFFHPLMQAPLGYWEPLNLHPYVGFLVHKTLSLFNPKMPLMYSVSFTALPIVLLGLCCFLTICTFFRCSGWTSLIAAVYFLLAPIFLKRSCVGWYDDDPYNILFPLLILTILFYSFKIARTTRQYLFFSGLIVLVILIYTLFWHGWVFFESVLMLSGLLILTCNHFLFRERQTSRNLLYLFAMLLGGVLVGVSLMFGPKEFFTLFAEGWTALNNFLTPQLAAWPDLYIAVGELRRTPGNEFVELLGGQLFLTLALLGLVSRSILAVKKKDYPECYALIILVVFFSCITFMALEAQRFVLMSLLPFSIFFLLGLQFLFSLFIWALNRMFKNDTYRPFRQNFVFGLITLGLIGLSFHHAEKKFPSLLNQIYNATWDRALTQIKAKTPTDSVINTWWPPGHFIKAMAERRVTFDGASINKPQAYWIASAYLAREERVAAGILRMLNNSANQATEYLQSLGMELADAVLVLKTITPLGQTAAINELSKSPLSAEQVRHLLELTHKSPPPTYLLIYNDLAEKSLQLSFVAGWNFRRATQINHDPQLLRSIKRLHQTNYIKFLWEIAGGGPPRTSDPLPLLGKNEAALIFAEGILISPDRQCRINSTKFGQGIPASLVYADQGTVVEKVFEKPTLTYSVLLYRDNEAYSCMLMERYLAQSLIMRLYFFKGEGLRYFIPLVDETDPTRRTRIVVYRVDWERFLLDIEGRGPLQ